MFNLPESRGNPTTRCRLCARVIIFHEWDMTLHLLLMCPHEIARRAGLAAVAERAIEKMNHAEQVRDGRTPMERRSTALRYVLSLLPGNVHADVCKASGMPLTIVGQAGVVKMKEAVRDYSRSRNYLPMDPANAADRCPMWQVAQVK